MFLIHFLAELDKEFADVAKGVKHFHFIFHCLRIVSQHFLGTLQRKTFFFYQVVDRANIIDVLFGELSVAFAVFFSA